MWNLINPKLDAMIPQEKVVGFIKDLIYIAIKMMKTYLTRVGIPLVLQGTRTIAEEQREADSPEQKE